MAKGIKRKDSDGENVEAYGHETETRKNVVPARLASYDTSTPKIKKYDHQFKVVFDAIKQLMTPPDTKIKSKIGFRRDREI